VPEVQGNGHQGDDHQGSNVEGNTDHEALRPPGARGNAVGEATWAKEDPAECRERLDGLTYAKERRRYG
jgi:hypothetical protein